eukprot:TRINITY_DN11910_c0_g2_i1.p1 TRINITY_DN11910_c0_g2~~TRINITY_DN11910_c0_g2_i1.p1  ORF type:complete len:261 (+),score=68.41 TRINITY_DN11910_c0_g2_i1:77-859(+)
MSTQQTKLRNVGGSKDEPFWRYRRPELDTKIEGRGGSIRTVVRNMGKVAKAIKMLQVYPTKFFSMELGARVKCSEDTGVSSINGVHERETLEALLDKFIDLFVLCPECKLPEISLMVKEKDGSLKLTYDCDACGSAKSLKVNHKLKTFILKNPPAERTSAATSEDVTQPSFMTSVEDDSEVVWFSETSTEAQDERRKEAEAVLGGRFLLDQKEAEQDEEEGGEDNCGAWVDEGAEKSVSQTNAEPVPRSTTHSAQLSSKE